jgi:DNA-binding CsgD family transcriptional regulator
VSHPVVDSLTVLGDAAGTPVAPHVAARLDRVAGGDLDALGRLAVGLSAEQLAGRRVLPDPLPLGPGASARVARLDDVGRRLLLCVAVAVVDRVDALLQAADAQVGDLLAQHGDVVEVTGGRVRVLRPDVVALVRAAADLDDVAGVHAAWARAARDVGETAAALWHTALGTVAGDELLADGLLELASLLRGRGDVEAAHAVAREAVNHGTGRRREHAFLLAGVSALWSGHLADAERWLQRARRAGDADVRGRATCALDLARGLTSRPAPPPGDTTPGRPARGPGATLGRLVEPLVVQAPPGDRAALEAVAAALHLVDVDPDAAHALLGRTAVEIVPAPAQPGWTADRGAATPLAEAHVRVVQTLFLLCADQTEAASAVLDDALERLPVTHVLGGVVAEVAHLLDHERIGRLTRTAVELRRVGPRWSAAPAIVATLRRTTAAATTSPATSSGAWPGPAGEPSLLGADAARGPGASRPAASGTVAELPSSWSQVLTVREHDVVRLVVRGLPNREVARRLHVSVRTVEVHLGRAFRKLGVRSRSELVVLALRPG